jgi:hypothetical protein
VTGVLEMVLKVVAGIALRHSARSIFELYKRSTLVFQSDLSNLGKVELLFPNGAQQIGSCGASREKNEIFLYNWPTLVPAGFQTDQT